MGQYYVVISGGHRVDASSSWRSPGVRPLLRPASSASTLYVVDLDLDLPRYMYMYMYMYMYLAS